MPEWWDIYFRRRNKAASYHRRRIERSCACMKKIPVLYCDKSVSSEIIVDGCTSWSCPFLFSVWWSNIVHVFYLHKHYFILWIHQSYWILFKKLLQALDINLIWLRIKYIHIPPMYSTQGHQPRFLVFRSYKVTFVTTNLLCKLSCGYENSNMFRIQKWNVLFVLQDLTSKSVY